MYPRLASSVLQRWISPYYLQPQVLDTIRTTVVNRPYIRYAVLDGFYREDALARLIEAHGTLKFSEEMDRRAPDGTWLPYDGAVKFATPQDVGGELMFSRCWHEYIAWLLGSYVSEPAQPVEIKLRYHRPRADGFWIHTDGTIRRLVAISYFNQDWGPQDGGALQLWLQQEPCGSPFTVDSPQGRMDFLTQHKRIRTSSPGGGLKGPGPADFLLLDQVLPLYNRLFLCDFENNPAYHSVTPSGDRERLGVVQWLK